MVLWSLAFERDAVRDKSILARRVIRLARPGDIILMHDGSTSPRDVRSGTVRELDTVLAGLERRGFQFATVPELIHPRSRTQLASGR